MHSLQKQTHTLWAAHRQLQYNYRAHYLSLQEVHMASLLREHFKAAAEAKEIQKNCGLFTAAQIRCKNISNTRSTSDPWGGRSRVREMYSDFKHDPAKFYIWVGSCFCLLKTDVWHAFVPVVSHYFIYRWIACRETHKCTADALKNRSAL